MRTFPARYGGRCHSCDLSIYVDDLIRMTDEGAVHAACPDPEPKPPERPEKVCPTCWLTSCDCDRG